MPRNSCRYKTGSRERRLAQPLAKLLGAEYRDEFNRKTTHLLCPQRSDAPKCVRAAEKGVPMLRIEWLRALRLETAGVLVLGPARA